MSKYKKSGFVIAMLLIAHGGSVKLSATEVQITSVPVDEVAIQSDDAVQNSFLSDDQLEDDENLTNYTDSKRTNQESGETFLTVEELSKTKSASENENEVYYTLDDDGIIEEQYDTTPTNSDQNVITVYDGTIVDSDSAIARTSGGYETTFYVYQSMDDLKAEKNGVPISGGGFDATFIESIYDDGKYYAHIKISGLDGYTEAGNIQIIPEELIQARSHYTVEDGELVYYSAIDSLTSTDYERIVIDQAPAEMEEGIDYYSDDDENFYTTPILTSVSSQTSSGFVNVAASTQASVSYNSYFMNLPMRSASSYTAANYNAYLKSKGKTSSEYYGEASAFTDAQNLESVNSLLMFAMANHESAYGTSTYAQACYNFFGRGAIDSDPDKACESYSFKTATDGILAQAIFLQSGYFDILDWRYSGTHVGNKASGINVKYASDVDWGKKISNHAYMIDQYLGGKDENKYALASVSGQSYVYTSSDLSTKVKSSSDSQSLSYYDLSQMTGTSDTVNVVVLQQTANAYQIYVPTAVKNSSSVGCSFTSAMRGSYPNYNGRTTMSVANNTANYSCDYKSFSNNKYWIKKSGTTLLNNTNIPYAQSTKSEYYSNGKLKYKFYINPDTNVISYANGYDTSGNLINVYEYQSGTKYGSHSGKIKNKFYINSSTGAIRYAYSYNTSRKVTNAYEYQSGTKYGSHGSKVKYKFYLKPGTYEIKYAYGYNTSKKLINIYEYQSGTKYRAHSGKIRYKFVMNSDNKTIKVAYRYNSSKKIDKIYQYRSGATYGSQSKLYKNIFFINPSTQAINYAYVYNSNNKVYVKYTYQPNTYFGKGHGSRIKSRYYY